MNHWEPAGSKTQKAAPKRHDLKLYVKSISLFLWSFNFGFRYIKDTVSNLTVEG